MKGTIEFQKDILNNLSDEELCLLIKIIPANTLLEPIKKHPKEFKAETRGYRLNTKSKIIDKLPSIYFNRFKNSDVNITNGIAKYADYLINTVNNRLITETTDETYLSNAMESNDINLFANLIEFILMELKPEDIRLFFKLIDYQLTASQNEYIDNQMPLLIIKLNMREKLQKELRLEYDKEILKYRSEYKDKIGISHSIIADLKSQIQTKKGEIIDCKKATDALIDKSTDNEQAAQTEISKLKNSIIQLRDEIKRAELQISEKTALVAEAKTLNKVLSEKLKLKNDEFSALAKEIWELENEDLIAQHQHIENDCERLRNEEKVLKSKVEYLKERVNYWDEIVNAYVQNIDKSIIENALNLSLLDSCKSTTKNAVIATDVMNLPYTKEYIKGEKISSCSNIIALAENIANNLESTGVGIVADEIADYIIGVLVAGLVPLICGYQAREIATAISLAYSGETPYIITLPNGYTNAKMLSELYCNSNSSLILIEDAVGTMNENALFPLLREKSQVGFTRKILVLSVENMDSLKYMPNNLYNYVALVSVERIAMSKKPGYIYSDAKDIMQSFSSSVSIDESYKRMKKLLKNFKLGNSFVESRANIIAYSNKLSNMEHAVQGYVRSELILFCKYKNMYEQIEKNIALNDGDSGNILLDIINGGIDE